MDDLDFENLTRFLVNSGSRRRLLAGLVVGAATVVGRGGALAANGCRAASRTCSGHTHCCSKYCGPKDATGRRRCACSDPSVACAGQCVDPVIAFQSDPDNCGSCGHRCPHARCQQATCTAGVCGLAPNLAAVGRACDDGDPCTTSDVCQSDGSCAGTPVVCASQEQCYSAACDPTSGRCVQTPLTGTACDDGDACTQTDICQDGVCAGSNPVVCTALDQCHVAGTCDSSTGSCSNPARQDGTVCAINTHAGACQSGTCVVPERGTCPAGRDVCSNEYTVCNLNNDCACYSTITLGTVCGNALTTTCQDCSSDADWASVLVRWSCKEVLPRSMRAGLCTVLTPRRTPAMVPETEEACPWTFDDFCLWIYCLVDDLWPHLAPLCRRPGPAPVCSDPELLTMALIGECKGWHEETVLLSEWGQHRDVMPHQPSRTRFNRRRRQLQGALNQLRRLILGVLDLAADRQCVLDSLPVPVMRFHLVPAGQRAYWESYDARIGYVASKQEWIFGYKLYVLVTLSGVILDFVLAPANVGELQVGTELVEEHTDVDVLGDKAFVSAPLAARLATENGIRLLVQPRRNQRTQIPAVARKVLSAARQMVETVNSQLAEQFGVEVNHTQSFWGLTARLYTKLTAHTLCLYLNRLLGKADVLHLKELAFPQPN